MGIVRIVSPLTGQRISMVVYSLDEWRDTRGRGSGCWWKSSRDRRHLWWCVDCPGYHSDHRLSRGTSVTVCHQTTTHVRTGFSVESSPGRRGLLGSVWDGRIVRTYTGRTFGRSVGVEVFLIWWLQCSKVSNQVTPLVSVVVVFNVDFFDVPRVRQLRWIKVSVTWYRLVMGILGHLHVLLT